MNEWERERDNNFHPKNASKKKSLKLVHEKCEHFYVDWFEIIFFFLSRKKTTTKSIEHESDFMLKRKKKSERERECTWLLSQSQYSLYIYIYIHIFTSIIKPELRGAHKNCKKKNTSTSDLRGLEKCKLQRKLN